MKSIYETQHLAAVVEIRQKAAMTTSLKIVLA